MKHIILIWFSFLTAICYGQTDLSSYNGQYYLLEAERGATQKFFEYGEHNGKKILLIASCQKCLPASYHYLEGDSEDVGIPIFFNKIGLYILGYDKESFVMIMPNPNDPENWTNFAFSNFYSKNANKVKMMSKTKIADYIKKLAE